MEKNGQEEVVSSEKLLIDDPSDFQFHAAYLAYSETYDKTNEPQVKKELNQNIEALKQDQIDYPAFYRNISQYRTSTMSGRNQNRFSLKTQRKREWRRSTQKRERIKRHKK